MYYQESLKSDVKNSTKKELITKIYSLDHISYETIVSEASLYYIHTF